jgi:hypothetical protein
MSEIDDLREEHTAAKTARLTRELAEATARAERAEAALLEVREWAYGAYTRDKLKSILAAALTPKDAAR